MGGVRKTCLARQASAALHGPRPDAVVGALDSQEEAQVVDVMPGTILVEGKGAAVMETASRLPAWTPSCEGRLAGTPPARGRLLK